LTLLQCKQTNAHTHTFLYNYSDVQCANSLMFQAALAYHQGEHSCIKQLYNLCIICSMYEGWNFNNGNYLFTTDTK